MDTEKLKSSISFQGLRYNGDLEQKLKKPQNPREAALQSLNCAIEDMAKNNEAFANQIRSWKIEISPIKLPLKRK